MSSRITTDGSSHADAHCRVIIDRGATDERWRYRCPNGHVNWARTNNHIWCQGCLRQVEAGEDIDPEHYEVVDARTGETIPWAAVEIRE